MMKNRRGAWTQAIGVILIVIATLEGLVGLSLFAENDGLASIAAVSIISASIGQGAFGILLIALADIQRDVRLIRSKLVETEPTPADDRRTREPRQPPRWKVSGRDESTGEEKSVTVRAANEQDAFQGALAEGLTQITTAERLEL